MNKLLITVKKYGGISLIAGISIALCFVWLLFPPSLRGAYIPSFLAGVLSASIAYTIAITRLEKDRLPVFLIWTFAILFRSILLVTSPTLSDDVFRYIWDGHLLNQGINPYAFPVESAALDPYDIPIRSLVNHPWMASPYLPSAQILFVTVGRLLPGSVKAYQAVMLLFDLGTGWFVMDILRKLSLPKNRVLIYLWNPLVILEFSHAAHIDTVMIFLIMASFWLIVRASPEKTKEGLQKSASVITMAGAVLTKAIPGLLSPLLVRRWGVIRTLFFGLLILFILSISSIGAGFGLSGPSDGTGVFGAVRIFMQYWNFNSSIYHWLEVVISGYPTPGAVPVAIIGEETVQMIRTVLSIVIGLISVSTGIWAWHLDDPRRRDHKTRSQYLLRLAVIPLGVYIILTHTVHPWYLAIIIPFLPFLLPRTKEDTQISRFIYPWLYLSFALALSYITYFNPEDLREYQVVRLLEYLPFFALLAWAAGPFLSSGLKQSRQ